MKKKILKMMLVIGMCGTILSGCRHEESISDRFISIETDAPYEIYVDTKTGVEYLRRGHGFTVLLDADGNPLLAEGYSHESNR